VKRDAKPLDWTDRDALRRWFADLSAVIDDARGVTSDMLLPKRERTLGPAEARRLHREADEATRALLDAAERGLVSGSRKIDDEPTQ
jgi:hypothetical protein